MHYVEASIVQGNMVKCRRIEQNKMIAKQQVEAT